MIWVIFSRLALGLRGGSEQDGVLLWGQTQLVVERVVPDLLHVVSVVGDAVFNGILECQDAPLGLGLVANVAVLLAQANYHTPMSGAAHDRRGHGRRASSPAKPALIIPEAFHHSNNQACDVIAHFCLGLG